MALILVPCVLAIILPTFAAPPAHSTFEIGSSAAFEHVSSAGASTTCVLRDASGADIFASTSFTCRDCRATCLDQQQCANALIGNVSASKAVLASAFFSCTGVATPPDQPSTCTLLDGKGNLIRAIEATFMDCDQACKEQTGHQICAHFNWDGRVVGPLNLPGGGRRRLLDIVDDVLGYIAYVGAAAYDDLLQIGFTAEGIALLFDIAGVDLPARRLLGQAVPMPPLHTVMDNATLDQLTYTGAPILLAACSSASGRCNLDYKTLQSLVATNYTDPSQLQVGWLDINRSPSPDMAPWLDAATVVPTYFCMKPVIQEDGLVAYTATALVNAVMKDVQAAGCLP